MACLWLELHCDLSFDVPEDICDYQFTDAASCQESAIFLIANGCMIIHLFRKDDGLSFLLCRGKQ